MIKCVLVDDELPMLAYLQALCGQLPDVEMVKSYKDPMKFLSESDLLDFNTCVLDITMPGLDGLQLARRLAGKAIIFSTAHKEYAAEAYDLDAVDYLRKPYQPARLEKAFAKAGAWLAAQPRRGGKHLELNTNRGKAIIPPADIAYIVVADNDRRDKLVTLKDGGQHLLKNVTFDQLLQDLSGLDFCRINRKTVIALDTVMSYTAQWVRCSLHTSPDRVQFSLSEQYRAAFISRLPG